MVGQRFIASAGKHFVVEVTTIAASPRVWQDIYRQSVDRGRWTHRWLGGGKETCGYDVTQVETEVVFLFLPA